MKIKGATTILKKEAEFLGLTMEELNYAFRYTQNTDGSWSKKIGSDANENVEVLHYRNDGYGLRSSMVGDTFTIWFNNKEYKKFKCMPIGFQGVA